MSLNFTLTTQKVIDEIRFVFDERDRLRQALEIIAVGDSKDPVADAGDELVELGYWRRESLDAYRAEGKARKGRKP